MVRSSQFAIQSEVDSHSANLTVVGELDIATLPQLQAEVQSLLAVEVRRLTIDLRLMTFVDSSGLRLFIALSEASLADGWTLQLIRPAEEAFTVFRITGAGENLPFIDPPTSADGVRA